MQQSWLMAQVASSELDATRQAVGGGKGPGAGKGKASKGKGSQKSKGQGPPSSRSSRGFG
jgi:hypothetical protein